MIRRVEKPLLGCSEEDSRHAAADGSPVKQFSSIPAFVPPQASPLVLLPLRSPFSLNSRPCLHFAHEKNVPPFSLTSFLISSASAIRIHDLTLREHGAPCILRLPPRVPAPNINPSSSKIHRISSRRPRLFHPPSSLSSPLSLGARTDRRD